jgi:hypothetical protein
MWVILFASFAQGPAPAAVLPMPDVAFSSARCVSIAASPDERIALPPKLAPGPPPVLSFRYYEGQLHHRFENMDLMLDDAGH